MNKNKLRSILALLLSVSGLVVATSFAQPAPAPAPAATSSAGMTSQGGRTRVSPHATTSESIGPDRALIVITYGRPYTIKPGTTLVRKIWGGQVPWDKADRLGADEATLLITPQQLVIGETTLPAGAYALYIIPSENGTSKLAFSSNIAKWGIPVDEKHDVGRFDLKKETLPTPVDQLTITIVKDPNTGPNAGMIKIAWETTQFSLPFSVKK